MGSNLSPDQHLPRALELLAGQVGVVAVSRAFETPALGEGDRPEFLNAAILCRTEMEPLELRDGVLREIEHSLGRRRSGDRNAPRSIDLDISLFGDRLVDDPGHKISIPDPDVLRYAHVAVPLAELSPAKVHPASRETLLEIAQRLGARFTTREVEGWGLS